MQHSARTPLLSPLPRSVCCLKIIADGDRNRCGCEIVVTVGLLMFVFALLQSYGNVRGTLFEWAKESGFAHVRKVQRTVEEMQHEREN